MVAKSIFAPPKRPWFLIIPLQIPANNSFNHGIKVVRNGHLVHPQFCLVIALLLSQMLKNLRAYANDPTEHGHPGKLKCLSHGIISSLSSRCQEPARQRRRTAGQELGAPADPQVPTGVGVTQKWGAALPGVSTLKK